MVLYPFLIIGKVSSKDIYNTLLIEKAKWTEISNQNYSFKVSNVRTGGMARLFNSVIIVENKIAIEEIQEPYTWEPYLHTVLDVFPEYSTIDNIYNDIEKFIDFYNKDKINYKGYCKSISIEYDQINHIPIKIEYDYWHNPFLNITDRLKYYAIDISDFKTIKQIK